MFFQGQEARPRSSAAPGRRFHWHDEERDDDDKVYIEFNWANPDHISQLNDWRKQFHRRQSAVTVKPSSVDYHPHGKVSLWQRHAEHLEEEVRHRRIDPADGGSHPLRVPHAKEVGVGRRPE
jgi:hypothetical protein